MEKTGGKIAIILIIILAAVSLTFFTASSAEIIKTPDSVTLIYDSKTYKYSDNYIEPTDFTVKEEFERRKINAPTAEKTELVYKLISGGADVKDAMLYCFPKLDEVVKKAVSEIKKPPVDSEIRFYPKKKPMFEISKSMPGYKLEEQRIYSDVLYAFAKGLKRVSLVPTIIPPAVHESELIKLTELRSTFTTTYAASSLERKHNIKLSMSHINGMRLGKGETFSFNKTVGPRTEANGFLLSKIIVNGKYVEGVGGGVCQASTTVYNSALLAGMKIVSVSNHSLTPSYIQPSFDAMVNADWSDLKFSNPFDEPVFIRTVCTDESATVEFYSVKLPYKIKTESVVLSKGEIPATEEFIDKELKYTEGMTPGSKVWVSGGSAPLKSEGYLIYEYENGQTKKVKIRTDNYRGVGAQIAVAPGAEDDPLPDEMSA